MRPSSADGWTCFQDQSGRLTLLVLVGPPLGGSPAASSWTALYGRGLLPRAGAGRGARCVTGDRTGRCAAVSVPALRRATCGSRRAAEDRAEPCRGSAWPYATSDKFGESAERACRAHLATLVQRRASSRESNVLVRAPDPGGHDSREHFARRCLGLRAALAHPK